MSQWDQISGQVKRLQAKTQASGSGRLSAKMMQEAFAPRAAPRRVGEGQTAMAAVTELETQPFKWDTNCFYRRLGVDPYCERVEIARAFGNLDPRHPNFSWYATAARVLLKKPLRAAYDRLALGAFWSDDPDLKDYALEGMINGDFLDASVEWGIYADPNVSDEMAESVDPAWRPSIVEAVARFARRARTPYPFFIGLGACRGEEGIRWETIGYIPVLFVPIDTPVDRRYVEHAAELLVRNAVPMGT